MFIKMKPWQLLSFMILIIRDGINAHESEICRNVERRNNINCDSVTITENIRNPNYCQNLERPCNPACHRDARCQNGQCVCNNGFQGNGQFCFHCNCDRNAVCRPAESLCVCNNGYEGDGFTCRLSLCNPPCHANARCENRRCVCNSGFLGNGTHCYHCDCDRNAFCQPSEELCICNRGYIGNGFSCTREEVPRCSRTCHQHATCHNEQCECNFPYLGDGVSFCYDCERCHPMSVCQPSASKCICRNSYLGNGFNCSERNREEIPNLTYFDTVIYKEALSICKAHDSELLIINDVEEYRKVKSLLDRAGITDYWINGNDLEIPGRFMTLKGHALVYLPWHQNEPKSNGIDEHCIVAEGDKWRDVKCNEKHKTVCIKF